MKKFIALILVLMMCLSFLIACQESQKEPDNDEEKEEQKTPDNSKKFKVDSLSITLTKGFKSEKLDGYTAAYLDEDDVLCVFVLKEKFSLMEGFENWTVTEYANAVRTNTIGDTATAVKTENNITYFEYDFYNDEVSAEYHYYTTVFKDSDCFWTVQFSCLKKDASKMMPEFLKYAQSVIFE